MEESALAEATSSGQVRRYRKGEKRYKHVSRTDRYEFEPHRGHPKKFVGKCPNNIPQTVCEAVLAKAIPGPNPAGVEEPPRRLYAFHDGMLFEFRLSDHKQDYHAFPLRGRMPKSVTRRLREDLGSDAERRAFDAWIDNYVQNGA